MQKEGLLVFLPDTPADFLLPIFLDVGPTMPSGMGPLPLTYSELDAWSRLTGSILEPWEARALVGMSREYAAFSVKAERADCPSPMAVEDEMNEERRQAVANSLKSAFGALMTKPPKQSKVRKRTKKGG